MKGKDTRAKYVETAAQLFQSRGFHGVGLAELIDVSGAPKGSFYFHFKGGKEELAIEAVLLSREAVLQLLNKAARQSKSAAQYVERIGSALMRWLKATNFTEGCAVASMTLAAAGSSPAIALACRDSYRIWIDHIHIQLNAFSSTGLSSRFIASSIMAAFEGAVVICRSEQSVTPLKQVIAYLAAAQHALDGIGDA